MLLTNMIDSKYFCCRVQTALRPQRLMKSNQIIQLKAVIPLCHRFLVLRYLQKRDEIVEKKKETKRCKRLKDALSEAETK